MGMEETLAFAYLDTIYRWIPHWWWEWILFMEGSMAHPWTTHRQIPTRAFQIGFAWECYIEFSYPRESMAVAIDYGHGVLRDYSHTASYLWRIRSDYLEIYEWEPHHSGALSAYDATGTESRLDFTTFRPSEDSSSYVHPVACDSGEAGHNG